MGGTYYGLMPGPTFRTAERHRLVEPAKLRTSKGENYSCMIRDISSGGAMLRVPVGFNGQGWVWITSVVTGNDRQARIAWQDRSSIGVAFQSETAPISAEPAKVAR